MKEYDFAVGWSSVGANEDLFIESIKEECKIHRMSFLLIDDDNVDEVTDAVARDRFRIRFYLDMLSEIYDPDDKFTRLVYCLKDSGTRIVDDPDDVKAAADKSITHFDLARAGVPVPYTVVIRNWEPARRLTREEKRGLGFPFVIKPALGYGKKGVKFVSEKRTLQEIARARKFNRGDNFLLQRVVEPVEIEGIPAWFRVYHLFGEIIPCWWDHTTNIYRQVTLRQMDKYRLLPLVRIASEIGRITRIDWFSCEIALDKKMKKFVVIDYMNDQCAIYPKSHHKDGVPDDVVTQIASRIVEKASHYMLGKFTLTYRAIWLPKIRVKDEDA